MNDNSSITFRAIAKYIRISPTKVRYVLKQIQGCSYEKTLILLEFLPHAACRPIAQVIRSAASNAYCKAGIAKKDLCIKEIFVNKGPVLKRFKTRSQGRAFSISKPTCHITVIVTNKMTM
jgi:large subunit ribosomal protein L22